MTAIVALSELAATMHIAGVPIDDDTVRCIRCLEPISLEQPWSPGDHVLVAYGPREALSTRGILCKPPQHRRRR